MACPGSPLQNLQDQIDKLKAENAALRESLRWLVIDVQHRFDECQEKLEPGSKGGYSPQLTKAIRLVEGK